VSNENTTSAFCTPLDSSFAGDADFAGADVIGESGVFGVATLRAFFAGAFAKNSK
jgi:hypothetical protein